MRFLFEPRESEAIDDDLQGVIAGRRRWPIRSSSRID